MVEPFLAALLLGSSAGFGEAGSCEPDRAGLLGVSEDGLGGVGCCAGDLALVAKRDRNRTTTGSIGLNLKIRS